MSSIGNSQSGHPRSKSDAADNDHKAKYSLRETADRNARSSFDDRAVDYTEDSDELIDTKEEPYFDNPNADYTKQVSEDGPKNKGNVIGGYKATISNPKVSEEAKDHARDILKNEFDVEM